MSSLTNSYKVKAVETVTMQAVPAGGYKTVALSTMYSNGDIAIPISNGLPAQVYLSSSNNWYVFIFNPSASGTSGNHTIKVTILEKVH